MTGTAVDRAGHEAVVSAMVNVDATPPALALIAPSNGAAFFVPTVTATGTLTDEASGLADVSCNTTSAIVIGDGFRCTVSLTPGENSLTVTASDRAGNTATATAGLTYTRTPVLTITSPADLDYLNISPTTVTGTVDDATATVTINSIVASVANGSFSMPIPLAEGPNIVTVTASAATGGVGTASVAVTLDTTPPRVTVTSPADASVTTAESISVAGNVNDIVVGTVNDQQAQVRVTANGVEVSGQVANRTFLATDVPLAIGSNIIQAIARDRVGNQATTQITVIRKVVTAARIRLVSGNNQSGPIRLPLGTPLTVALTDTLGEPVANKPVIFKVTQNDGVVTAEGMPAPTVVGTTDAEGKAQAQWTLGARAGAGGNVVEAYSVGYEGIAVFTATGTQGAAGKIVIDTGNDQVAALGQALPKPLIAVVVDEGNNRLAGVPVTFRVRSGGGSFDGQPELTVNSDSDGRVAVRLTLGPDEGIANNLVDATFEGNQHLPATFGASGRAPGNPANTTITGVVLDNSNIPIPGVTIRAVLTNVLRSNLAAVQSADAVETDGEGQFTITQAPVGLVKLLVDGSTAERDGTYPSLEYDMVTVAGQPNTVGQPIFLLPLNTANQLCVTGTTGGGTLTIPEAPGFSLTFGPGQVTFPGGTQTGCISVTVVHGDKVPMVPGFGQQPRFIVTIQPSGAVFSPPAPITLPNVDGLEPRRVTEMYSYDHDISSFVAIGTGVVSDDGLVIRSSPGVGVLKSGWHCGGDPNPSAPVASLGLTAAGATSPLIVHVGEDFAITASASPPDDGIYQWPAPGAGVVIKGAAPSCPGAASCTANFTATQAGVSSVNVCFTCTTTGHQTCTTVEVKVWGVQTLTYEAMDSPLDANPSAGGGLRIYPEKRTATDSVNRKRVRVKATITPVLRGRTVYFKSFDVDDPSTNDPLVDANGPAGNDNRGGPQAGTLGGASATTDDSGVATVELTVTPQPGNNFKVAASGNSIYVNGLAVDTVNLKDSAGGVLPTNKGKPTDLLTVWRKVHVEVDSMGVVTGNDMSGNITGLLPGTAAATGVSVDNSLNDGSENLDTTPPNNGRFERGTLTVAGTTPFASLDANGNFRVQRAAGLNAGVNPLPFSAIDNDIFFGSSTMGGSVTSVLATATRWVLTLNVTAQSDTNIDWPDFVGGTISIGGGPGMTIVSAVPGRVEVASSDLRIPYAVKDDDRIAGDVPMPDSSTLVTSFAPAYVLPVFDVGDNNNSVPIVLNAEPPGTTAIYDFDAGATEADPDFWTVYLLGSYQAERVSDSDPDREGATLGIVDNINGIGAKVFEESLREFLPTANLNEAATTAHEIGHLFNGLHGDLGLMSQSSSRTSIVFSPTTLNKIRSIPHP